MSLEQCDLLGSKTKRYISRFQGLARASTKTSPLIPPDQSLLATEYPYSPNTLTQVFTKAIRGSGIEPKGRSLYSLRHTFVLQEYFRTGDIYFVKQALGHSHVTITERYLKFPTDYLQQVFGESITPYHADQRWANLSAGKP